MSLLAGTLGSIGMWSVVVVLPAVQAEFGLTRAQASLAYTATMLGFAFGGALLGGLADRRGVAVTSALGASALALGYAAAGLSGGLTSFALAQGLLIGFGASATFAPLVADISHWFLRRRGIAVAICACGNYLAGTIWPPLLQAAITSFGWRTTHLAVALLCAVALLPLSLAFRRRAPAEVGAAVAGAGIRIGGKAAVPFGAQGLLVLAGFACCVAMAMPQVQIVAYCGDLGYGVARGSEMLSLMLGLGVVSRIASGFIADRLGGLRTALLGSALQALSLMLYLGFDGLALLYVISGLFGLVQGGIVPSYAVVVREYFPAGESGARVGGVVMATVFGMAFGGWASGAIFDLTGGYAAAFANGIAWNLINLAALLWLLHRLRRPVPAKAATAFGPA